MKLLLPGLLMMLATASGPATAADTPARFHGANLTHVHTPGKGYGSAPSRAMHAHLDSMGYDAVQIVPFGYMERATDTVITFADPAVRSHRYITLEQTGREIAALKAAGFRVMVKPHLWVGTTWKYDPDNWRNVIDFADAGQRAAWFRSYYRFLEPLADLCEKNGAEVFVIGTELVKLTRYTDGWYRLIAAIRKRFSGSLTYACEGLNAGNIRFWDALDYIGLDAYYPLTPVKNPSVQDILDSWGKHADLFSSLYTAYGKPVILTELGYKSQNHSLARPWEWENGAAANTALQADAFEAAFRFFMPQRYFAGYFVWKYFTDNDSYEQRHIPTGFTPFGKPAETVIRHWNGKD